MRMSLYASWAPPPSASRRVCELVRVPVVVLVAERDELSFGGDDVERALEVAVDAPLLVRRMEAEARVVAQDLTHRLEALIA